MTIQNPPASTEADMTLLHRFIETGDPATFTEIVQRYARVVFCASLRVLGDEARAQDVSQETFFRLMQRPRLVTHSLAGWLHRNATHLALDVRRSEKSRRQREHAYGIAHQELKATLPTWSEVSPFVDQALNEITEPTRGLLIRHFLQGIPQTELAEEMNVSAATLSRRIKGGLEQLQQGLRKKGIYLSLAMLAGFCATRTDAAIPATLITQMGKMNLVGSLRHLPTTTAPPLSSFPIGLKTSFFVPPKFAIGLIAGALLLTYFCVLAFLWSSDGRHSPVHQQAQNHPE